MQSTAPPGPSIQKVRVWPNVSTNINIKSNNNSVNVMITKHLKMAEEPTLETSHILCQLYLKQYKMSNIKFV
jgi:hypothetical protein